MDSPRTLVLQRRKACPEIRKGSPRARGLNESGVGKIRNFRPISRRISEMLQGSTNITNRTSHTPFRFVPKSTLDDPERPLRTPFQNNLYFGAHHEDLNKDRSILVQRQSVA